MEDNTHKFLTFKSKLEFLEISLQSYLQSVSFLMSPFLKYFDSGLLIDIAATGWGLASVQLLNIDEHLLMLLIIVVLSLS